MLVINYSTVKGFHDITITVIIVFKIIVLFARILVQAFIIQKRETLIIIKIIIMYYKYVLHLSNGEVRVELTHQRFHILYEYDRRKIIFI